MSRIAQLLGAVAVGCAAPFASFAQGGGDSFYGPHMWEGGWWMFLGPLWMIVVIGTIVAVVVLVVRWLSPSGYGRADDRPAAKTPMDILRERFARGEIDTEEFEKRRKLLE